MDVRELIRSAQHLELKGDHLGAAARLETASQIYLKEGNSRRAAQLLRYAVKLAPDRTEIAAALKIAEGWTDKQGGSLAEAWVESSGGDEPTRPLRGPTRADPFVDAWCSFCCRPDKEVGLLVAGPAGAFICGGCIESAANELSGAPVSANAVSTSDVITAETGLPVLSPDDVEARLTARLVGQEAPLRRVLDALKFFWHNPATAPVRTVAIAGPKGTGKSTALSALAGPGPRPARLYDASVSPLKAAAEAAQKESCLVLVDNAQAWRDDDGLRPLRDACRRGGSVCVAAFTEKGSFAIEATVRAASADVVSAPLHRFGDLGEGVDVLVLFEPLKADALRALLDAPATYFPELSSIAQKWLVSQAARDELLRMAESAKSVEPVRRALLAAGMAASAGQTREEIVVDGVESTSRRRKKPPKPPAE